MVRTTLLSSHDLVAAQETEVQPLCLNGDKQRKRQQELSFLQLSDSLMLNKALRACSVDAKISKRAREAKHRELKNIETQWVSKLDKR